MDRARTTSRKEKNVSFRRPICYRSPQSLGELSLRAQTFT